MPRSRLMAVALPAAFAFGLLGTAAADVLMEECAHGDAASCERACADGDAAGCYMLGNMYRDAVGVERDEARAVTLYGQSCEGGHAWGCSSLGDAYLSGLSVTKDDAQAVALYKGACEADHVAGCANLGDMYAAGLGGVETDEGRAAALYKQACDGADLRGCTALKALCGHRRLPACAASSPRPATRPRQVEYDQPPRPIKIVKPLFPQKAFEQKIEGTVEVEILIDATGKVSRARIVQSIPALDQAALETVYQWSFSPAIKNGRPVASIARAPVQFRIY